MVRGDGEKERMREETRKILKAKQVGGEESEEQVVAVESIGGDGCNQPQQAIVSQETASVTTHHAAGNDGWVLVCQSDLSGAMKSAEQIPALSAASQTGSKDSISTGAIVDVRENGQQYRELEHLATICRRASPRSRPLRSAAWFRAPTNRSQNGTPARGKRSPI